MSPTELKLHAREQDANTLLCVGLDSELAKIPEKFQKEKFPQFEFNKWIIEQTHEYVSAYKPNSAYYEMRGDQGIKELKMTIEYLQENHPEIFTILDAKRGDIGSTNSAYITSVFDWYGFDSVTIHSYLGQEAMQPFLDREDKSVIILCRTSNPGAGEFQDLLVDGEPLWKKVTQNIVEEWNYNKNCMLVVGATYPKEMKVIRELAGEMTFLVPGIGAQGGSVQESVMAGLNGQKQGMIINSARGIIFNKNPAEAAKELRDEINKYR